MNQLQVIVHRQARVLTTGQLAESYGTENKVISNNFNRNKERYTEGKHFISLTGEEKRNFINLHQIEDGSKNAATLYLWTEKGAWLHAKSLNTDAAWDAYEMLVDEYYNIREIVQPMTPSELALLQAQNMVALEKRVEEQGTKIEQLEAQQENITQIVSLNPNGWKDKANAILNRIAIARGGGDQFQIVRNESYDLLENRARCKLNIRLDNRKKEALANGIISKAKIAKFKKIDVIEADTRLTEIYLAIVKEMAIAHKVNAEGLGA